MEGPGAPGPRFVFTHPPVHSSHRSVPQAMGVLPNQTVNSRLFHTPTKAYMMFDTVGHAHGLQLTLAERTKYGPHGRASWKGHPLQASLHEGAASRQEVHTQDANTPRTTELPSPRPSGDGDSQGELPLLPRHREGMTRDPHTIPHSGEEPNPLTLSGRMTAFCRAHAALRAGEQAEPLFEDCTFYSST